MVVKMVQKVEERGAKIKTLIGDNDSTTITRVRANVDKDITKGSDSSHMKKIVSNMLHYLRNTNKSLSLKIISYLKKLFNYMLAESNFGKPDMIKEGLEQHQIMRLAVTIIVASGAEQDKAWTKHTFTGHCQMAKLWKTFH